MQKTDAILIIAAVLFVGALVTYDKYREMRMDEEREAAIDYPAAQA